MRRSLPPLLLAAALGLAAPRAAAAQEPSALLPVGAMAPDIVVEGATRYGVLANPVRLSDFRGQTVVLAFYFRVRGGG